MLIDKQVEEEASRRGKIQPRTSSDFHAHKVTTMSWDSWLQVVEKFSLRRRHRNESNKSNRCSVPVETRANKSTRAQSGLNEALR